MRWTWFTFFLLVGTIRCSEEDSNEVITGSSLKPPINLDSNLRKALLKALVELENEEKENHERSIRNEYVNIIPKSKTIEKAPASQFSYVTHSSPLNMTVTVKKSTSKPKQIVVIQKSEATQHKVISENQRDERATTETPEQFIASASSSITSGKIQQQSSKSEDQTKTSPGGAQLNSIASKSRTRKLKHEQTTTLKPTTSTVESEANVESLQFFSAPLVAAFTVHQDEKGVPKSVVPIYKDLATVSPTTEKQLNRKKTTQVQNQQKELDVFRQEDELRRQQKRLEEEIRRLTKLKEEQERIIQEQKLTYEQKLFEQQRNLFDEQTRLLNNNNNIQSFVPLTTTTTTQRPFFQSTNGFNNNRENPSSTLVSIQPSLGFIQSSTSNNLPLNAQILPVKNAVDFRTPFAQSFQSFKTLETQPIIPNTSPAQFRPFNNVAAPQIKNLPFSNPLQNSIFPQTTEFFQSLPSFQRNTQFRPTSTSAVSQTLSSQNQAIRPFQELPAQSHVVRNLRQETGTGNFLNNNRLNIQDNIPNFFVDHRFNRNPFNVQQTQFFRPTFSGFSSSPLNQYNTLQYSVDQPFLNQRLNNLLLSSGLSQGRQQEDLNIVSKVLSFNHLGGGDIQFSNPDSQRTRTPTNNWRLL